MVVVLDHLALLAYLIYLLMELAKWLFLYWHHSFFRIYLLLAKWLFLYWHHSFFRIYLLLAKWLFLYWHHSFFRIFFRSLMLLLRQRYTFQVIFLIAYSDRWLTSYLLHIFELLYQQIYDLSDSNLYQEETRSFPP